MNETTMSRLFEFADYFMGMNGKAKISYYTCKKCNSTRQYVLNYVRAGKNVSEFVCINCGFREWK